MDGRVVGSMVNSGGVASNAMTSRSAIAGQTLINLIIQK